MKNLRKHGFNTDNKTYIIAEIGINHGGDIDTAKRLIESAAKTGVDAVKFQTYLTEKRVEKNSPIFEILKKCELPFSAFGELKEWAKNFQLDFFSTPFDEESVDCLEEIHCDLYKVASFDLVNHKLLDKVASTKKPVILSVGMSNLDEIKKSYAILKEKTNKLALLHCISAYPTAENDANLRAVHSLGQNFDCIIGQSDHTPDIDVSLFATAVGAQILEKHYMIDDNMDCVDRPVSISQAQMTKLVTQVRRLEKILGDGVVMSTPAQKGTEPYRRPSSL